LSDLALVPYAKVDGQWTLPDSFILDVARQCKEEKTFDTVFYDGQIKTEWDFLEAMQRPVNVPVFVFKGMEPLGFAWLNGVSGNYAFAHFCMMRDAWGTESIEVGKLFLKYWMSFAQQSGAPLLELILGVIPGNNKQAHRFTEKLGFVRLGEIPMLLYNAYSGDRNTAVILYFSRFRGGS